MNNESIGGVPSLESLRAKEDGLRASGKDNIRVRMGRALSWTERGQEEMERDDPDAAFIFYWIGFDALCSGKPPYPNTKGKIDAFLEDAVGADWSDSIYNVVIASESKTILTLAANAYVFTPFWGRYYDEWKSSNWADPLIESVNRAILNLERGERGTFSALKILFDRLVELRNQLVHGGATWEDRVNRDQVGDGARIMSRLLPVFLELAMDNPDSFNAGVGSPPPEMDSSRIKSEHNDYVRRLSDKARNMVNSEYRDYLREAIERELKENNYNRKSEAIPMTSPNPNFAFRARTIGGFTIPTIERGDARRSLRLPVSGFIANSISTSRTGKARLDDWKKNVMSAVKAERGGRAWNSNAKFAVSIGFRFNAANHGSQPLDVENFLKPVVDALAAGLF